MAALIIKLKTKSGQQVIRELNYQNTILDLKKELSVKCGIADDSLSVLSGFPPKPFSLANLNLKLSDSGLKTGDTLIVDEKLGASAVENTLSKTSVVPESISKSSTVANVTNNLQETNRTMTDASYNIVTDESQVPLLGPLLRKVVPADDSCLFTSVGFVISGKIDPSCSSYMRQLIVEHVKADPENFNEAILGKAPAEYCDWIMQPASWGGGIEVAILARYYGMEIAIVDTMSGNVNRFGEDVDYPHRVLLIFDGIHYDALYMEHPVTGDMQTIFPADDFRILDEAKELAQESKSSKQYTDVKNFRIKCLECQLVFNGQKAAHDHATTTKHVSFGEVV